MGLPKGWVFEFDPSATDLSYIIFYVLHFTLFNLHLLVQFHSERYLRPRINIDYHCLKKNYYAKARRERERARERERERERGGMYDQKLMFLV